ncbi:MAG TPA: hypothetical protein ENN43_06000 [bacterium]|nr:hypothetical protein [bacterium]
MTKKESNKVGKKKMTDAVSVPAQGSAVNPGLDRRFTLDFVSFVFAVAFVIALCAAVNSMNLFPDANKYANLNSWDSINPEPMERLLYILVIIVFPLLFLVLRRVTEGFAAPQERLNYGIFSRILGFLGAAGLIWAVTAAFSIEFRDSVPPYKYINNMLYETNMAAQFFLTVIAAFLLVVSAARPVKAFFAKLRAERAIIAPELLLLFIVIIVSFDGLPKVRDNFHFEAVFYSVSQIYNGKTALVDFTTQYGLYAHFLEPVFRMLGGLTVWKFQLVMGVMIALSWIALYFFMKGVIKNRILLFIGFTAALFYAYVNFYNDYRFREYYQYFPIRSFFPMIWLLLAAAYIKTRSRVLYYIVPVFLSAAVLWNPDTGIMALLSWAALLLFMEARSVWASGLPAAKLPRKAAFHLLNIAEIFAACLVLFALIMYFRSGAFPDYTELTRYQRIYYQMGFGLMPMPAVHPWYLYVAALAAGIALSLGGFFAAARESREEKRGEAVFLLAVFGTLTFAYYQGRSHDWAMVPILYVPLVLGTLFIDAFLDGIKKRGGLKNINAGIACMILVILFGMTAPLERAYVKAKNFKLGAFLNKFDTEHNKNEFAYLKPFFKPGEEVFVISAGKQSIIYAATGAVNPVNVPGQAEISLVSDIHRVRDYLLEEGVGRRLIWDRSDGGVYVNHFDLAFWKTYQLEAVFPDSQVEIYRQYGEIAAKEPLFTAKPYLFQAKRNAGAVFTYIDKEGVFARNFHFDSGAVVRLGAEFCVEILLKPHASERRGAEIAGNLSKNRGIRLVSSETKPHIYHLAVGTGAGIRNSAGFFLEPGRWSYLAVSYSGSGFTIFVNGEKKDSLSAVPAESAEPFKIQNKWYGFRGEIEEMLISGRPAAGSEIEERYEKTWTKAGEFGIIKR